MQLVLFFLLLWHSLSAQLPSSSQESKSKETELQAPSKIEIKPTARDFEIEERLEAILKATGWFKQPHIEVKEGVVFLQGETENEEYKTWAGNLARNTQDVSAVVNKIKVSVPSVWNFEPSLIALHQLWQGAIRMLPVLGFAIIIFILSFFIAKFVVKIARKGLSNQISSPLLQEVIARAIGFCIFLMGLYIIFKMMGLTTIAFTIIGGTGILGIILGIAFRDITENLLASIFLSIHHPFRNGDLVEIEGIQGYVQRLTIRSTVLMSLTGNQVQIPNATVYKSNIWNFTVNPNRQESFTIVIGYDEEIPKVQEIALKVLEKHPAVLKDPEPLVLVDGVEKATVVLRIYFWLDGNQHSWLRVKSSVIRLIKRAFQEGKISMPGTVQEVVISQEIPVALVEPKRGKTEEKLPAGPAVIATDSEAKLSSESNEIKEQARQSRPPGKGEENLLN